MSFLVSRLRKPQPISPCSHDNYLIGCEFSPRAERPLGRATKGVKLRYCLTRWGIPQDRCRQLKVKEGGMTENYDIRARELGK
jgi:hypothetical protein